MSTLIRLTLWGTQENYRNYAKNNIGEQLRSLRCNKTQRRVIKGQNPIRLWRVPPINKGYCNLSTLEIWKMENGEFKPL